MNKKLWHQTRNYDITESICKYINLLCKRISLEGKKINHLNSSQVIFGIQNKF